MRSNDWDKACRGLLRVRRLNHDPTVNSIRKELAAASREIIGRTGVGVAQQTDVGMSQQAGEQDSRRKGILI
jgi:hypothetical protein